jgi:hypothetical protein
MRSALTKTGLVLLMLLATACELPPYQHYHADRDTTAAASGNGGSGDCTPAMHSAGNC